MTRDQQGDFREGGAEVRADYLASRRPHNIGKIGGGDFPSGAQVVHILEGHASQYSILALGDGRCAVVRHSDIEGRLDRGRALTGNRFTADARSFMPAGRERAAREQAAGREMAAQITDFWKRQSRRHG